MRVWMSRLSARPLGMEVSVISTTSRDGSKPTPERISSKRSGTVGSVSADGGTLIASEPSKPIVAIITAQSATALRATS